MGSKNTLLSYKEIRKYEKLGFTFILLSSKHSSDIELEIKYYSYKWYLVKIVAVTEVTSAGIFVEYPSYCYEKKPAKKVRSKIETVYNMVEFNRKSKK